MCLFFLLIKELRVSRATSRVSRGTAPDESEVQAPQQSPYPSQTAASDVHPSSPHAQPESNLLQPLVMQFSIVLQVRLPSFLFLLFIPLTPQVCYFDSSVGNSTIVNAGPPN